MYLVAGLPALGEDVGHDESVGVVVIVRGGGHRRLRRRAGGFVWGLSLAGGERTQVVGRPDVETRLLPRGLGAISACRVPIALLHMSE
jgi:hypothetical protein